MSSQFILDQDLAQEATFEAANCGLEIIFAGKKIDIIDAHSIVSDCSEPNLIITGLTRFN